MTTKNKYHGKLLEFPDDDKYLAKFADKLPKRDEFIDEILAEKEKARIQAKKYVVVMPTDHVEIQTTELQASGHNAMVSKLILYGVMRSGQKVAVILDNIKMFFDIMVPPNTDVGLFQEKIESLFKKEKIYYSKTKMVMMKPFTEYLEEEKPFLRVYFKRTNYRKNAIEYFLNTEVGYYDISGKKHKEYLQTFENDISCHYRKVCRENQFTFGDWNTLEDYRVRPSSTIVTKEKVDYIFQLDVKDFKDANLKIKNKTESMLKDKTMVSCWDLETIDTYPTGNVPTPEDVFDDDDKERSIVFMDATTFGWNYSNLPFLKVCISELPVPKCKGHLTIMCKNQTQILKAKALLWGRMNPEYIFAFNDGAYDWPFIIRRIEEFDKKYDAGLMEFYKKHMSCVPYTEANAKWTIKGPTVEDHIKLEADLSITNEFFKAPGYISMDVRTVFRQLFPKMGKTGSLNAFLKACKLELKEDMDYKTMFQIKTLFIYLCKVFKSHDYEKIKEGVLNAIEKYGKDNMLFETRWNKYIKDDIVKKGHISQRFNIKAWTLEFMLSLIELAPNVASYNVTDAQRCQELMHKKNVVMDRRAISKRSYTPMYDCLYRAGGMKVRNLVQAEGRKPIWNLAFNSISIAAKDPRKYPGAYVVPPIKGLCRDHVIIKNYRRRAAVKGDFVDDDGRKRIRIDPKKVDPRSKKFDKTLLDCVVDVKHYLEKMCMTAVPNDENDKTDLPLTGLDFSSLYPNICITYNLSREKCIYTIERMKEVLKKLRKKYPGRPDKDLIHPVEFRYGLEGQEEHEKELIQGWFVRHIPIYTEDPETKKRDYTGYEGMGLYPSILLQLYNEREAVKKQMNYWGIPNEYLETFQKAAGLDFRKLSEDEKKAKLKEAVAKNVKDRDEDVAKVLGTRKEKYYKSKQWVANTIAAFFEKEYFSAETASCHDFEKLEDNCIFYFQYYKANEQALKVFMNTFYGEAGNSMSAFFEVRVAGGITTWGQYNIRMMKKFVESKGYGVRYGDTDSLYVTPPPKCFKDVNKKYLTGKITKLQYWTELVEITMELIDSFKDDVNRQLMEDNGTPFLKMAYEEVLWPYALTGKKKYGGIPHMGIVDATLWMRDCPLDVFMKSLFVRGWEFKKRGCSEFAAQNSGIVLKEAFCIDSTKTLKEIVEDEIKKIVETKWDPKVFIKTAKFKPPAPDKPGNISVVSFMKRMQDLETRKPQLGIKARDPGERYDYVVVRRYPWSYDYMGRKVDVGQGDKYEYFESLFNDKYKEYLGEDLEVDMDYYMTGEIAGQFGRYLVYHPDYDKFFKDDMTDEEYKAADDKAVKYAKKMLTEYYNQRYKHVWEDRGAKYKVLAREVGKAIIEQKKEKFGGAATVFGIANSVMVKKDFNSDYSGIKQAMKSKLVTEARKAAKKGLIVETRNIVKTQLKNERATPYSLYALYVSSKNALGKMKEDYVRELNVETNKKLNKLLDEYIESCKTENQNMRDVVNELRKKIDKNENVTDVTPMIHDMFTDTVTSNKTSDELVYDIYDAYINLVTVYRILEEVRIYKEEINMIKREKAGELVTPYTFNEVESDVSWGAWLDKKGKLNGEIQVLDDDQKRY